MGEMYAVLLSAVLLLLKSVRCSEPYTTFVDDLADTASAICKAVKLVMSRRVYLVQTLVSNVNMLP